MLGNVFIFIIIVAVLWGILAMIRDAIASLPDTDQSKPRRDVSKLSKRHQIVIDNSERIQALNELNKSFVFKSIFSPRHHNHWCNNKREFDRLSIYDFFKQCVSNNYREYKKTVDDIEFNRTQFKIYIQKVRELSSTANEELCRNLKISLKKFQKREDKLFKKFIQRSPAISITIDCKVTYTSPRGRNHYKKSREFYTDDLKSSLETIEKERQRQQTREYSIKAERAKMSDSLRYDILRRDGFKCQICGASADDGVKLHVDHIVPVSKGGRTVASNLRTLCERCNLGKSDKIEHNAPPAVPYQVIAPRNNDWELQNKIRTFWAKAHRKVDEYIKNYDIITLKEFIYNIWNTRDKVESASDLHALIEYVVWNVYPIRDYNEGYRYFLMEICQLQLTNTENYIKTVTYPPPYIILSATKFAILLEQDGRIDEAIELCDFCIKYNIKDVGYKDFESRKAHLLRKGSHNIK